VKRSVCVVLHSIFDAKKLLHRGFGLVRAKLSLSTLESGLYDVSLANYFEALKISDEKKLVHEGMRSKLGIAWNYYRLRQFDLATQFVDEALEMAGDNSWPAEISIGHNLLGLIAKATRAYPDALENFNKALAIRRENSDKIGEAATLGNIGEVLEAQGKLKEALDIQHQSLELEQNAQHQSGLAWVYRDLGSIHSKLGDFRQAEYYLDKGINLSKSIGLGIVLTEAMSKKREILRMRGLTQEALTYSVRLEATKDSVQNAILTSRITALQGNYEIEKRDREIQNSHS
ncbi:MAG TPA: tetratricopeptide repeat protein, partial [Chryseolinea sp.]